MNERISILLLEMAETLSEMFEAVEERFPASAGELGDWVEQLGIQIGQDLKQVGVRSPTDRHKGINAV